MGSIGHMGFAGMVAPGRFVRTVPVWGMCGCYGVFGVWGRNKFVLLLTFYYICKTVSYKWLLGAIIDTCVLKQIFIP